MRIKLNRGFITRIDNIDAPLIKGYSWYVGNGYVYGNPKMKKGIRKKTTLHRVIMGARRGEIVDHINGDPLDNRRLNLRFCSKAQNGWNAKHRKNKLGFKGVFKSGRKFGALIQANKKRINLGFFDTLELAAKAYDKAAKKLHGSFSKTNF